MSNAKDNYSLKSFFNYLGIVHYDEMVSLKFFYLFLAILLFFVLLLLLVFYGFLSKLAKKSETSASLPSFFLLLSSSVDVVSGLAAAAAAAAAASVAEAMLSRNCPNHPASPPTLVRPPEDVPWEFVVVDAVGRAIHKESVLASQ
jgi:hypothetical protein